MASVARRRPRRPVSRMRERYSFWTISKGVLVFPSLNIVSPAEPRP